MHRKLRLPSPAMAVALAALFVALSGTAVAAGVPALAKRALVADNAKKLGGKTPALCWRPRSRRLTRRLRLRPSSQAPPAPRQDSSP